MKDSGTKLHLIRREGKVGVLGDVHTISTGVDSFV